ncbi:MAG: hypothetical protein CENE_02839 [Candidatus Celerinatantimonas neptuna]|nr:MAG: hypothetical protein CENE_02839 [Candidatus Celerinatantimonas neptuna]
MSGSWLIAFLGGICIGASALLLLVFNGRIAGISGIVGGLLQPPQSKNYWRGAFVVGLLMSPWLVAPLNIHLPDFSQINPYLALIAGLLVGVGTRISNGCTSGHGICGMGRLSIRSIVATLIFIAFGILTASLLH